MATRKSKEDFFGKTALANAGKCEGGPVENFFRQRENTKDFARFFVYTPPTNYLKGL